nr:filamentous hemagglutinin N-terminal domain-containing protein [Eoetvoesiella caeni]
MRRIASGSSYRFLGGLVLVGSLFGTLPSYAAPTGGQITAGSGAISQTAGNTTVSQASQNLSLNWQSFNVGAHEAVNFVQPNAAAIAVNRIADTSASQILGSLNANGQVFLINPNGIVFGAGAQVNVGGLVASTLNISDSDLASATRHFSGSGAGAVVNHGTITAAPGGYVALLGRQVSNQGTINAPGGTAALGAGSAVSLSFDANHLLSMQVDANELNALAENKQLIVADGGQVLMSAGAKNSLLASVVNNTGVIQAQTVASHKGQIVLLAGMEAGTSTVNGTLDASAPDGGDGGFIETSGAYVQVADAARISTLAANGKTGTWHIHTGIRVRLFPYS